ncbi:DUF4097 family beta strand repeat-containing protein [Marinilabilia rubra]|uniref:DUF4097 domain-containing protein n=1 Tax=Marinilabilia rubra TaxID=2162893 RepID=A0A2U2BDB9_9BACT|nr:DUF4097 family beta strand repeat-containing protein [Marinilabilia rubra]PWE01058.1 hypothetical protein DDZ16_00795 [Marinilabilia rubra]
MKRLTSFLLAAVFLSGCMLTHSQELVDHVDTRFQNVESINIEGVFCDVNVEAGGSKEVHLQGEIRTTRDGQEYSIKTSQSGGELKIWVEHPNSMRGRVKGFLILEAPRGVNLSVNNVSGNVKVDDIESDHMLLKSVSGDVTVSKAGGDSRFQSVSGNVQASVINGALKAKSVSGDLRINNVKGDLSASSTSGNVSARMVEGEAMISSTSGDVMVENLMNSARLKSTSGNIKVDVLRGGLSAKSVSGDIVLNDVTGILSLSTTSGSQRGTKIVLTGDSNFKSVSGDINMDLENAMEALSFFLKSGSGNLSAAGSSADERLEIEKGEIVVKGSSMSGNQTFR